MYWFCNVVFPPEWTRKDRKVESSSAKVPNSKKDKTDVLYSMLEKRLPQLAVAYLGRGQIIGENELHKNIPHYENTFVVASAECEILEIPMDIYKKHVIPADRRNKKEYKDITEQCSMRKETQTSRSHRAHEAIETMLTQRTKDNHRKEQLNVILPLCATSSKMNSIVGHMMVRHHLIIQWLCYSRMMEKC